MGRHVLARPPHGLSVASPPDRSGAVSLRRGCALEKGALVGQNKLGELLMERRAALRAANVGGASDGAAPASKRVRSKGQSPSPAPKRARDTAAVEVIDLCDD